MTYFKARDVLGVCVILLTGCGESAHDSTESDGAGGRTTAVPNTNATGGTGATVVGSGGASAGTTTVPGSGSAGIVQGGASSGGTKTVAGNGTGGVIATGGVVGKGGASTGGTGVAGAANGGAATGGAATGGAATGGADAAGASSGGTSTGGAATGGADAAGASSGGTSTAGTAGTAGSPEAVAGNGNEGGTAGAAGADNGQAGGTGANPLAECFPSNIKTPNVVVLKDATPNGADSQGKMWIGGNLTISGSYSVNATTPPATTCSEFALIVGGNISGDPYVRNGKAAYGGTLSGNFSGDCGIYHTSVLDFVAIGAQIKTYSAALSALPANGTVTTSGGYLVLTGTSTSLNVFNLTAAEITASHLSFVASPGSTILVNISGTTANWAGKGFKLPDGTGTCKAGTSSWCHNILYNFYEATSLMVTGIGVQGSILAPNATFDGGGGNVDGQVFVNYLKGGVEYHPYLFTGCLKP